MHDEIHEASTVEWPGSAPIADIGAAKSAWARMTDGRLWQRNELAWYFRPLAA
ncbi:MAG: hypothetical protein J0H86_11835 [Xanthomonadaceae bacterium]|nr:hypothetical protein [Xanthomonadaceae bacterium]